MKLGKPIFTSEEIRKFDFYGISIHTERHRVVRKLIRDYRGMEYSSGVVLIADRKKIKSLIDKCDKKGNFQISGEDGMITHVVYDRVSSDHITSIKIPYEKYKKNGAPERVRLRTTFSVYSSEDEREGRK